MTIPLTADEVLAKMKAHMRKKAAGGGGSKGYAKKLGVDQLDAEAKAALKSQLQQLKKKALLAKKAGRNKGSIDVDKLRNDPRMKELERKSI